MTTATKAVAPRAAANPQQNRLIIVGIIGIAIVAAVVFVIISLMPRSSGIVYDTIPQTRLADGGFVLGNPESRVTIVEFADYYCPHCQDYKPVADRFIQEFVMTGQAQYEFRVLPTAGASAPRSLAARLSVLKSKSRAPTGMPLKPSSAKSVVGNAIPIWRGALPETCPLAWLSSRMM